MWEFEHTLTKTAKAESIWKLYSDISTWSTWDKGIEKAILYGAFNAGTKGQLQPIGKEASDFEITEAEPNKGFSDRTEIPNDGLIITFIHHLQSLENGTIVKHRVIISGPNASTLGPQFGEHFKHGIPSTMVVKAMQASV
jgi:hypothetical protein